MLARAGVKEEITADDDPYKTMNSNNNNGAKKVLNKQNYSFMHAKSASVSIFPSVETANKTASVFR